MDWLAIDLSLHHSDLLLHQSILLLVKRRLLRCISRDQSKQIFEVVPECSKLFENRSRQSFGEGVEVVFEGKQAVSDGGESANRLQNYMFVVSKTLPEPPLLLH